VREFVGGFKHYRESHIETKGGGVGFEDLGGGVKAALERCLTVVERGVAARR
jgi:hypothetical protein